MCRKMRGTLILKSKEHYREKKKQINEVFTKDKMEFTN